ncbi:RNA 2',3'-cyclic phosphodiesterase [Ornithinimicrobium tianjinense]|uniref:RNA 2',3'-cyclic phosphodiesterase n=1 Tax=Ornithinimicrobium tianjinense TaxID=1195761 RepID=A0A917F8I6_9MICO|nr:RNA 2',3'-cyclic phosphodiesterase [Ornithinimicrobium tianjinense]GGF57889.1 RNA 2',3'-cyclic phosphodiesterase [Ornithinimicrobium tianjinense]
MRAFLAVVPPAEVVESVEAFLEPRRDALSGSGQWRWTRSEHVHLTLAFLPELEEWREEQLVEDGERWAERHTPVRLALAGAGAFPDPGSARVLWAAVEEHAPGTLAGWAKDLRALASHAGASVTGTRFSPHVTLARSVGRPRSAGHLLQALDTLRTPAWTADEVVLVASFLGQGPGGTPRYEVRHTWRL